MLNNEHAISFGCSVSLEVVPSVEIVCRHQTPNQFNESNHPAIHFSMNKNYMIYIYLSKLNPNPMQKTLCVQNRKLIIACLQWHIHRVTVRMYHFDVVALFIDNCNRWTLLLVIVAALPVLLVISLPVAEKSYAIYHKQFAAILLRWFEFDVWCLFVQTFRKMKQ